MLLRKIMQSKAFATPIGFKKYKILRNLKIKRNIA